jgi:alpha-pyrone synthase
LDAPVTSACAHIHAIGTAVPDHDIHAAFIGWAEQRLEHPRDRKLLARMSERAGIGRRWSVLQPTPEGGSPVEPGGFYQGEAPSTGARMELYAQEAPPLAAAAIRDLGSKVSLDGVTHLVVASCTGFVAPGIDQIIAAELGLGPDVERTLVGFMGCYAAVSALRLAHHIVRSEPDARVLTVAVELSSLHLQEERDLEPILAMLQFGDGAAAALVSAEPRGLRLDRFFTEALEESTELIRWTIGDTGFSMRLSGEVPGRIFSALQDQRTRRKLLGGDDVWEIDAWAVHPGGRSILDAVEKGLDLDAGALQVSRSVLERYGNMSSASLMFVLADILRGESRKGVAMAFGPGLAVEGFRFERAR